LTQLMVQLGPPLLGQDARAPPSQAPDELLQPLAFNIVGLATVNIAIEASNASLRFEVFVLTMVLIFYRDAFDERPRVTSGTPMSRC
jgi:hypothetical protein